jgi:membrane-associated phospholipid phosphatase
MADTRLQTIASRTACLIREDAGLYLFIACYALAGIALLSAYDAMDRAAYALYVDRNIFHFALVMPIVALLFDIVWSIHRFDRHRRMVFRRIFSTERLAHLLAGLVLLQVMAVFFGTFTSVKNVLPLLHGGSFPYDHVQANIDAALHGGHDPWRLLQFFLDSDLARRMIEWNYNVWWFLICYGTLFFIATAPRARPVRARYLFAFMVLWIVVGNVLAGLFLSAGPAFYGFVTGDSARFAEQMAFLAGSNDMAHSAVSYQNYLWTQHEVGQTGLGSGISAFPSVHVGLISLNAFFLYRYRRNLGLAAFAYVLVVGASSVYLAWHYAIDGYVAFACAALIYAVVWKWRPASTRIGDLAGGRLGTSTFTIS